MLTYPQIDPIAIKIGPLAIHWYGLMYLIGFLGAWYLAKRKTKLPNSPWTKEQVADLICYAALGVVLGGRLGYMLFYEFSQFIHEPWIVFKIWQGGMSFHGGLLGVILAMWLYSRKYKKHLFVITDFIAPLVPSGLRA